MNDYYLEKYMGGENVLYLAVIGLPMKINELRKQNQ